MPDSPENPAISSIIHPNEIKVEPQVVERDLDQELRRQLHEPKSTAGLYLPPNLIMNPHRGSHLIAAERLPSGSPVVETVVGNRFLKHESQLRDLDFGKYQDLANGYIRKLQEIQRYLEIESYRDGYAESIRAHETTHYYQQVRLGTSNLLPDASQAINREAGLKHADTMYALQRQRNRLAIFMEAQCYLAGMLHVRVENPQVQYDMAVYTMVKGLPFVRNSAQAVNTLQTNKLTKLERGLTQHTLAILILATQNPNLLEDISEGRLTQSDFETGLVAFYEKLLQDPKAFLDAVGSKEFQLAIDRQLILARDELKKTVDEVNATA